MSKVPFGFDKAEDSPGFALWQTTMLWQRQIKRALETYNVSHAQFVILATLMWFEAHNYDITQTTIINHTKLDKMTVSKSLKKLAALSYVKRIEHADDTRAKQVCLTNQGKELVKILVPLVENVDSKFFSILSDSEGKNMLLMMNKLITGANKV